MMKKRLDYRKMISLLIICSIGMSFVSGEYLPVIIRYLPLVILFVGGFYSGKVILFSKLVFFYIVYAVLISIIVAPWFGITSYVFRYIYVLLISLTLYQYRNYFTAKEWIDLFRKASELLILTVLINDILNYESIVYTLGSSKGHPLINYIMGGGANLEATWICMLGFLFTENRKHYWFCVATLVIACLYSSRTGIIIGILCLVYIAYKELKSRMSLSKLAVLIGILAAVVWILKMNLMDSFWLRLQSLGQSSDLGVSARMIMWHQFDEALMNNWIGYGAGNSVRAIEDTLGYSIPYSNIHNIYLQSFLDFGLIGGGLFIYLVVSFFVDATRNMKHSPISLVLSVYFIAGISQFAACEATLGYIIGLYFCVRNTQNIC